MRRRNFLQHACLLAAAAAIDACSTSNTDGAPVKAPSPDMPPAPRFPLGYQLYSVRDAMTEAPVATVRALLDMGYAHFEAHGYDAVDDTLYGLSPKQLKRELDALGTRITSAHFGFANHVRTPLDELHRYTDACLSCAADLDMDYLVWPVLRDADRTVDGFKQVAERLNLIGERLAGSGCEVAFHNNGGEFVDLGGGNRGYDIVLAEADPSLVKLELDMYWLAHDEASETPAELIAGAPDRFVMWHVKDMHPVSRDYTELGAGTIAYERLLPDVNAAGLSHLYLEQGGNFAEGSMDSAETNARHWRTALANAVR